MIVKTANRHPKLRGLPYRFHGSTDLVLLEPGDLIDSTSIGFTQSGCMNYGLPNMVNSLLRAFLHGSTSQ